MKSKYIEGTNKQHSIREDGVVLIHYNNHKYGRIFYDVPKISNEKSGLVIIGNKNRTVRKLMRDNLNMFLCKNCSCKVKFNSKLFRTYGYQCMSCTATERKIKNKQFRLDNPEYDKNKKKKIVNEISDGYIKNVLKRKESVYLPDPLLKLKRNQLKLFRELKNHKQNDTN